MHRELLRKLLEAYQALAVEEKRYKAEMLQFLTTHPDCFERSLEVGHFTASAWVLSPDGSKALLLHHRKLGEWFQLGGHCDGDCDVLAVAIKEALEESGLEKIKVVDPAIFDLDIHLFPETPKQKAHLHYDVRFLLQADTEEVRGNEESNQLLWINANLENIPTKSRSILRMVEKWHCLFFYKKI